MATIRRVTIHRLRNVKPGCTFELHPGLNVLLGQNGTGKTTLLQWMADFMSGDLQSWAEEPYRVEVEMEAEAEQRHAHIRLNIDNDVSTQAPAQDTWRQLATVAALSQRAPRSSVLTTEMIIVIGAARYEIHAQPSRLRFLANGVLLVDSKNRTLPMITTGALIGESAYELFSVHQSGSDGMRRAAEKQAVSDLLAIMNDFVAPIRRFDESLRFFEQIVEGREAQARVKLGLVPFPFLVPAPLSVLIENKLRKATSDVQMITFTSEEVNDFLSTAVKLFHYSSADVHLALLEKNVSGANPVSTYGNLRFTFHRPDGGIIGHDALSYGQKRMLSFLYYLALNPRLIIVDELVNGLHHAWIEACIDEIGDRQGLLTSQNPLLLDYLTFDSADEVRQRFILCRSEREDGREQLVWRNPNQEEAESFFRAYQAGIQHVGEILVDKGLW